MDDIDMDDIDDMADMDESKKLWQDFLFVLPDDLFFNIIRNYIGPVQTPYNKHDLIERLLQFIQRDDIQLAMLDQIDAGDMELLSAVDILGTASLDEIFAFFEDSFPAGLLYSQLLNLADRLLIFRQPETAVLTLNPFLRAGMSARGMGMGALIRGRGGAGSAGRRGNVSRDVLRDVLPPWFNDSLVIASLSILKEGEAGMRRNGSLKKSLLKRFTESVSGGSGWRPARIELFVLSLCLLGLVTRRGQSLVINLQQWQGWTSLGRWQRLVYYWAAWLMNGQKMEDTQPPLYDREELRRTAEFLHVLLRSLEPGIFYTPGTLSRIIRLQPDLVPGRDAAAIISCLSDLGIIIQHDAGFLLNPFMNPAPSPAEGSPIVNVHADYLFTLHPGAEFARQIVLALSGRLQMYDNICRFELGRETVLAGLALGLKRGEILQAMEEPGGKIPQNINFSIESWEDEFFTINIRPGYLLSAGDKTSRLIRNLAPKLPASEDLGNGHFLFPADSLDWVDILENAGISARHLLSATINKNTAPLSSIAPFNEKPAITLPIEPDRQETTGQETTGQETTGQETTGQKRSASRRKELEQQAEDLGLPEDLAKSLKLRIQEGLILAPEQFASNIFRSDISEAHGLNYNAKLRLIEQAVAERNLLEISTIEQPEPTLISPLELIKKPGADLLQATQGNTNVEIRISKIRHVRRLKSKLFNRL